MDKSQLKYSKEHEWVSVNGSTATIGITEHAAELLGDIVYVELPENDTDYEKMDRVGSIESVKTVSDLFTPVAGTVTELNPELSDSADEPHFEYVNQDPLGKGWLFKIKISNPEDLNDLMSLSEYETMIKNEEN